MRYRPVVFVLAANGTAALCHKDGRLMQTSRSRFSGLAPVLVAAAVSMAAALPARDAHATDFQLGVAVGGEGSAWKNDGAGFVGIDAAIRFADIIAPYFMARAGYANTDQRILELIQIGAQIWAKIGPTRPYFRAGMLHQHEESWPAAQNDVAGALVGIGDGIRHRFGGEFALGVDIPFKKVKEKWTFFATIEGFATVFPPDLKGPRVYGGGTAGLGFDYGL